MEAGYMGRFGPSMLAEQQKKVIEANKLVNEYNKTVGTLPIEEQMEYQREMVEKINKIIPKN